MTEPSKKDFLNLFSEVKSLIEALYCIPRPINLIDDNSKIFSFIIKLKEVELLMDNFSNQFNLSKTNFTQPFRLEPFQTFTKKNDAEILALVIDRFKTQNEHFAIVIEALQMCGYSGFYSLMRKNFEYNEALVSRYFEVMLSRESLKGDLKLIDKEAA